MDTKKAERKPFGVDLMVEVLHQDNGLTLSTNTKCTSGGDPTQKVETDDQ